MLSNLATDIACALDPVLLMRAAGIEPDDWQADVLRSSHKRILLLCSRQTGKSTVTATRALHEAIYRPGALILLLSPSLRQSSELFKKVKSFYATIPTQMPVASESALRIEFKNGSRIISLPGKEGTVRGFSGVNLLVIDEASRVPDELYYAVRPMLAVSDGQMICLTTPFGKRGFFFQEWEEGSDWMKIKVTAPECPRIADAFLEEERNAIGDWWYAQEYLCEFVDTVDTVFGYDLVSEAFTSDISTLTFR